MAKLWQTCLLIGNFSNYPDFKILICIYVHELSLGRSDDSFHMAISPQDIS